MSTIETTTADFEQTVTDNDIVFVDFWASWCGPCRAFAPTYEKVSGAHPDVVFAKVDTEAEQQLAGALQIQSIPTLMAFREGIPVFRNSGVLPEAALEDLVSQVQALDMEEVRAAVAKAQAEAQNAAGPQGDGQG